MKIKRFSKVDFRSSHSKIIPCDSNLSLSPSDESYYLSILNQYIEPIRKNPENFQVYDIIFSGHKVGNLHIRKRDNDTLSLEWIDIEKEHRGHSFATKVILTWIDIAKKEGYKNIILEVPGNAPDARHIYEKLGFIDTGKVREKHNKSWNGLSEMILKL